jgi:hypothetical protein
MPTGLFNPVIREAFTVAPEVVYSPIVPASFTTNRFDPDTAGKPERSIPEIREAITVAPEVQVSGAAPVAAPFPVALSYGMERASRGGPLRHSTSDLVPGLSATCEQKPLDTTLNRSVGSSRPGSFT